MSCIIRRLKKEIFSIAGYKDITDQRFGRLVAIKKVKTPPHIRNKGQKACWLCRCDCGIEKCIVATNLQNGSILSCGCLNKEIVSNLFKKYNDYDLSGEYGIGYTSKGEEFYFDLEDYDKIKNTHWSLNLHGYVSGHINRVNTELHTTIIDRASGMNIDHINRNRLDNRKSNLRVCTISENRRNSSLSRKNTSGISGVSWFKKTSQWRARITVDKKEIHLGCFSNKDDAIKARLLAEKKYFKEFSPQKHLYKQYGIEDVA